MDSKKFIKQIDNAQVVAAIQSAEQKTTGEIRVFVSRHEPADAVLAAQKQFSHLGMDKTKERNAVLIFIAPHVRKFAIIGDQAVHQRCGDSFWTDVAAEMSGHFKQTRFTEGLLHGIQKAGELLAEHFPGAPGHANQLPDDVEHD